MLLTDVVGLWHNQKIKLMLLAEEIISSYCSVAVSKQAVDKTSQVTLAFPM